MVTVLGVIELSLFCDGDEGHFNKIIFNEMLTEDKILLNWQLNNLSFILITNSKFSYKTK